MADGTHIEWTDATWNPITGCSVVSPGCANCYAMRLAGTRLQHHWSRKGLTDPSKAGPVWNGQLRLNPEWLGQPLRWKRPRMIFVCAHGDLFHESVPDAWIDQVFAVMALAPQHTFQVLTKRSARMRAWFERRGPKYGISDWVFMAMENIRPRATLGAAVVFQWPLPNVWLGVSAEDQKRADERLPDLTQTPAARRFLSAEPLLGPIDLADLWAEERTYRGDDISGFIDYVPRLDWVIVGGESGQGARPMHAAWARQIRNDCEDAGVAFFFKQWGEWAPAPERDDGGEDFVWIGKRAAGRLLDGREHNEMPRVA